MKKDILPIEIRGIIPTGNSAAIFVGNQQKVFIIQVEGQMGRIISDFLRDQKKERPLTHDLMTSIFTGFGISIERVVITELKDNIYLARLLLHQQNELGQKYVEVDCRPSDCLALACALKKPIFVTHTLFEQVEDMSYQLNSLNDSGEAED